MKCKILHESTGRIRIHVMQKDMTLEQADILENYLARLPGVSRAAVYERTCDAVIYYSCDRMQLLKAAVSFSFETADASLAPPVSNRAVNREFQEKLVGMIVMRTLRKLFVPYPLRKAWVAFRSLRYLRRGCRCLAGRKLTVDVLDAISIGTSVLRGDFRTGSSVMFLLKVGELLEEWTRKKAINDLAQCMSLNVDRVWVKAEDKQILVPVNQVRKGDIVYVHTGNVIPLDGKVTEGKSAVNQASLTGESAAVLKGAGAYVYAGTVVEEGECVMEVAEQPGNSRYDQIIKMIENSENLKSATENRALLLADRLVPYSLLGTAATYLLTKNITRAISILMVDFSCALKLAMPLSVLSAMRECGYHHITVKGGKYLEAVAKADTIVFDKTGTLTHAQPAVVDIIPFDGWEKDKILKAAACLEEHYPHSMANAVVAAASERGIVHEEFHSKVEYVVAHGIASRINGIKAVIGSYHFIFEDEKCIVPEGEMQKFESVPDEYSHLYMAFNGRLVGIICISDPLRSEAKDVLRKLKAMGISKTVMMTGDNRRTAEAIAAKVGVDEFYAEVLPEDKAEFVSREKASGKTVVMIGDGINDAPALSAASVGIAISDGAAIAREIADITIGADNLSELVMLKELSDRLQSRINSNYRFVLGFNGSLIAMGALGFIMPAASAMAHNLSTLAISLHSMTNLIKSEEKDIKLLNE